MHLSTSVVALVAITLPIIAALPVPGDGGSAYSGAGGNASGGNVITTGNPSSDNDGSILGLNLLGLNDDDDDDDLGLNHILDLDDLLDIDGIDLGGITGGPLLSAFSNNAGNGGQANSGNAYGGQGGSTNGACGASGNGGNAYSGAGGNAAGGSVTDNGNGSLISLFSNNAGNGGSANSGNAHGGNGGNTNC
ncbi:hypothetical protein FRB99_002282 [Tulasnella sp. 403]|nr:hypothetical protein FRB99_002282 [Tulasnella sp. 403]